MAQRHRYGPEITSEIVVGPVKPEGKLDVDIAITGFVAATYPATVEFVATPHTADTHYPLEIVYFVALPASESKPENPAEILARGDAVVHATSTIQSDGSTMRVELTDLVPGAPVRIYSVLVDTVETR